MAAVLRHGGHGRVELDAEGYGEVKAVAREVGVSEERLIETVRASSKNGRARFELYRDEVCSPTRLLVRATSGHSIDVVRPDGVEEVDVDGDDDDEEDDATAAAAGHVEAEAEAEAEAEGVGSGSAWAGGGHVSGEVE